MTEGRPRLLFDGTLLQCPHFPRASDFTLITFDIMHAKANRHSAFASALAAKMGYNLIGVVPKRPCWYPASEMRQVVEAVRGIFEGPAIAYGASMGGYGALRWGKALGATHVLACSPQATIDPSVTGDSDPRYARYYSAVQHEEVTVAANHLPGTVVALYDPGFALDRFQGELLAGLPGVHNVVVPHIGHHSAVCVSGAQNNLSVMQDLLAGNIDALRRRVLAKRKESPHYHLTLAAHTSRRGRHDLARQIAQRARTADAIGYHMAMAMIERRVGQFDAAAMHNDCVLGIRPRYPKAAYQLDKIRRFLKARGKAGSATAPL